MVCFVSGLFAVVAHLRMLSRVFVQTFSSVSSRHHSYNTNTATGMPHVLTSMLPFPLLLERAGGSSPRGALIGCLSSPRTCLCVRMILLVMLKPVSAAIAKCPVATLDSREFSRAGIDDSAADLKEDRRAAVEKLHGDAELAFYQWPGSRSGGRELLVLVRNASHVRSGAVSCLLVGKAFAGPRPSSCWEHAKSQGRYACFCKQRLRQLWEISASVADDAALESAIGVGPAQASSGTEAVGVMTEERWWNGW